MGVIFQIGMLFFKSVRYFSYQSVIFQIGPLSCLTDSSRLTDSFLVRYYKKTQSIKLKNLQMRGLMVYKPMRLSLAKWLSKNNGSRPWPSPLL